MKTITFFLLFLMLVSCTSDEQKRKDAMKATLAEQIQSEAHGLLTLTSFAQADDVPQPDGGYTVDWSVHMVTKQEIWKNGNALNGYWNNFRVATQYPDMGEVPKHYAQGAEIFLRGRAELQKAPNGWECRKWWVTEEVAE